MKILIIDHDPRSVRMAERHLKNEYVVDSVGTAARGEYLAFNNHYDVILIELTLPDMDGEDLCVLLKARLRNTPIIAITSKSSVADKDYAFEKGVDDYLIKPISGRELKARINAIVRRYNFDGSPGQARIMKIRDLRMDRARHMVTYKKERIYLRKKEFQLLEFLMLNQGKVLTRGEILENVWDMHVNFFTNTVDVHVKRLRDKIETPYQEHYFETIHGVGYLFE